MQHKLLLFFMGFILTWWGVNKEGNKNYSANLSELMEGLQGGKTNIDVLI